MTACENGARWIVPNAPPALCPQHVHIWSGSLDLSAQTQALCRSVLSKGECERADRFHGEADRRRFVAARGMLRRLLGHYVGVAPRDLNFSYGPNGKPFLENAEISFNVSHALGWGAWAFGVRRALGVDVEWMGRRVVVERIARRFFSSAEWTALHAMPEDRRRACFFQCWTRKEAFVKALGKGLAFSLKAFDVTVDGPARLLRLEADAAPEGWTLFGFDPAPEYMGAVAFENRAAVRLFRAGAEALHF